jgi:uncharacterized protein (DUF362 family)
MRLSIIADEQVVYPDSEEWFSPSTAYPEYRHGHLATRTNAVYAAVRQVFAQAGLDAARFGTEEWNPLGELVKPGQRVFVLCNFVQHRRANESDEAFAGKCTHGSVVRALVDYLLLAGARVQFGNAPVQSCNWESVLEQTGAARVVAFYAQRSLPVEAVDLRMSVSERDALGNVTKSVERDAAKDTIDIDLGASSLLDEPSRHGARYRVQDYSPDRTEAFHAVGKHIYVIHRAVLEADVVFSLPKLKTHEKVGVTCAVKGCVGAVGHKDCLAHHRFGPPAQGGDEYPRDPLGLFRAASWLHDRVQRSGSKGGAMRIADNFLRRVLRQINPSVAGAWWGNDTAWRMAVDLACIVEYADAHGVMHHTRVRRNYSLVDGVVGGQGRGPLRPDPVPSGTLFFADDVYLADTAAAMLMGFDPRAVPHLRYHGSVAPRVVANGNAGGLETLQPLAVPYEPPPGWRGHL